MRPDLSLVLPVFNEAENLPILLAEIRAVLEQEPWSWEIVAVDDGSLDCSLEVLLSSRTLYPTLRVLRLDRNRGQSAALEAGLRAANGRFLVTLDSDLQNDPGDIPPMMR